MTSENDPIKIANTLRIASQDLQGAKSLAASGNRNAVYLLEQAVENVLLAILTSEGQRIGRQEQHRLDIFVDKMPDTNPLKPRCRDITDLSRYATAYRYTTTEGNIPIAPTANYVTDKINKISSLLTEVANRFQVNLAEENTPAGKPDPIR